MLPISWHSGLFQFSRCPDTVFGTVLFLSLIYQSHVNWIFLTWLIKVRTNLRRECKGILSKLPIPLLSRIEQSYSFLLLPSSCPTPDNLTFSPLYYSNLNKSIFPTDTTLISTDHSLTCPVTRLIPPTFLKGIDLYHFFITSTSLLTFHSRHPTNFLSFSTQLSYFVPIQTVFVS